MKTNLLLLDSYKNMEELVAYAISFSHRTNRQLKIMYVFDFEWMRQSYAVGSATEADPVLVNVQTSAKKEFDDAGIKIGDVAGQYLKKHKVDVPVDIYVSDKNRIDLMHQELEENPDLVLMISNHQSYAEASGGAMGYPNLVANIDCPVLVIPDIALFASLEHVLYATNFNSDDISSLRHLTGLLQSSVLKIAVLHNEKDLGYEDTLRWKGFLDLVKEQTGIQSVIPVLTNEKKTLDAIGNYVTENNPDLLVVLKEKKGFFKEIFSTSNTKHVLIHSKIPVLVYHEV